METFWHILKMLSGPLIGAVIGYFTNYLAVKMLFKPLRPIYIGKWKLPFTPGLIPARQGDLAHAVGKAVGENLFTAEDLTRMLLSPEIEEKAVSAIVKTVGASSDSEDKSLQSMALDFMDPKRVDEIRERLSELLTDEILVAAEKLDIGQIAAVEAKRAIQTTLNEKWFLGLFVTADMADPLMVQLTAQINAFIREHGREKIAPVIREQVLLFSQRPFREFLTGSREEQVRQTAAGAYEALVKKYVSELIRHFDIASVVENKVRAMDVSDLEELCLSVMKKELNAIVNLGALIGFILGLFNLITG